MLTWTQCPSQGQHTLWEVTQVTLPPGSCHPWPRDTRCCSENWSKPTLGSFSTAQWGNQLGPWKNGAKSFQAIRGIFQGSHTFHTEASPLGV